MTRAKEQDSSTIAHILESTIECIAEQGYDGASMREIASRSGVAKSLLHYHFSTKEDLMLRAARYLADGIAEDIARRAGQSSFESSLEHLASMAADLYELLLGDRQRCAFMAEMYATAGHVPRVAEMLLEYRQIEYDLIESRVRDALGGRLEQGVGLVAFCRMVQTLMHGLIAQHTVLPDEEARREAWQRIVQTILHAMVVPVLE